MANVKLGHAINLLNTLRQLQQSELRVSARFGYAVHRNIGILEPVEAAWKATGASVDAALQTGESKREAIMAAHRREDGSVDVDAASAEWNDYTTATPELVEAVNTRRAIDNGDEVIPLVRVRVSEMPENMPPAFYGLLAPMIIDEEGA